MGYPPQGTGESKESRDNLSSLVALEKASLKWYWRTLAIIATISTLVCAVISVLSYVTR